MAMNFNLLPTGVGSVPHTDENEACKFILKYFHDIPFWPQLPKRTFKENMYIQFAYNLPNVKVEKGEVYIDTAESNVEEIERFINADEITYDEEYFKGFYEFLRSKDKICPRIIKGQVTGPVSLGLHVSDEKGKPIIYNDLYRELMIKNIRMNVRWQEHLLGKICNKIIISVDEPYLSMIGSPYVSLEKESIVEYIAEIFKDFRGLRCIHCCGNTDWSFLLSMDIDLLSFDAYNYGKNFVLYGEEIREFLRHGAIAWGIVPTSYEDFVREGESGIMRRFESLIEGVKGIKLNEFLQSSLLTPSCGLGSLAVGQAEEILLSTVSVSEKLRDKYNLGDEH